MYGLFIFMVRQTEIFLVLSKLGKVFLKML